MSHRSVSLHALGHAAEACLALLHLFDHAVPGHGPHVHDWHSLGEPVRTRHHLVVTEACNCGAVRCDRIIHDAEQGAFRRIGSTTFRT